MLVINTINENLLKMKEKLLEVSIGDNSSILEDYKKYAKEIDDDYYNQIIKKIENCNYNSLSFEEQIKFLSEIEDDYNYLNQLQWMFRNVYDKYTDDNLELSNINNILIDNVIERKSDIQGYLINIKNLDSNAIELDRLKYQLVSFDKENVKLKNVFNEIRNNLRNQVIKAEGRVYNTKGNMETISVVSELRKYGIDLKEIVQDSKKLKNIFRKFSEEKDTQNEMFEATINLPNRDEEICNQIEHETIECAYKYSLIELVSEVCKTDTEYDLFRNSLYKIADIIASIKGYLQKLGIKFYINPFDRIKIDSQIQVVDSMTDYEKEINNVKKTITYISSMIDETTEKNRELLIAINNDIKIIDDNNQKENKSNQEYTDYDETDDIKTFGDIVLSNDFKDNQVISLRKLSDDFKIDRAYEKTAGVIKRVYEMINTVPIVSDSKTPELILEAVVQKKKDIHDKDSKLDNDSTNLKQEHNKSFDIQHDITSGKTDDLIVDNSDQVFIDDTLPKKIDNNLFQEVMPFESTPLFNERYDSDIFDDNNNSKMIIDLSDSLSDKNSFEQKSSIIQLDKKKENDDLNSMMPDAFWVTKDDQDNKKMDKDLSFDEQVAALIEDDDQIKSKKKVA